MTNDTRKFQRREALTAGGGLACMALTAGTWFSMAGGVAEATTPKPSTAGTPAPLSFVQISDTHIGFAKPANPDPVATLRETIASLRALPVTPDFIVHTGDITHLASPAQFDLAHQLLSEAPAPVLFIPGEHDLVGGSDPRAYLDAVDQRQMVGSTKGDGWWSLDHRGLHVIGLVNVVQLGTSGQGTLGRAQLDWLKADLAGQSASTPIVLLSHFPLWSLYPQWGWGTEDAAEAYALLGRFGSVTALNGHIHQIQTRVEGQWRFHAGRSTAYPQPAPGVGPGPGPLVVPADQLRHAIGYSQFQPADANAPIPGLDRTLA